MRFQKFLSLFTLTTPLQGDWPEMPTPELNKAIRELPLGAYNEGLFTLIPKEDADALLEIMAKVGNFDKKRTGIFAADWLGKIFSVDLGETDSNGNPLVFFYDLEENNSYCTDFVFDDFLNQCATGQQESLFNLSLFQTWSATNPPPRDGKSCVAYKIPLGLGGPDDLENMALSDRVVSLHILAECHSATD